MPSNTFGSDVTLWQTPRKSEIFACFSFIWFCPTKQLLNTGYCFLSRVKLNVVHN